MLKHLRPHVLVLIALLTVGVSGWHEVLRNGLSDLRLTWDKRQASSEIAIVAIDAHSIERIGVWPWPRALHAELLRQLMRAGAEQIAFDVDFSAPSDPPSDQAFGDALQAAGGSVLLPAFRQPAAAGAPGAVHVNRPLPQFEANAWPVLVNVTVCPDGRVRQYAFGEQLAGGLVPSMAAALTGRSFASDASFLIDFGIDPASVPTISYVDVMNGDPAKLALLKGKKVIVGGTALELGDRFSVPNGKIVSGPLLQALAAESMLQGRTLQMTSNAVTLAGVVIILMMMIMSWRRLGAFWRVLLLVATSALVEAAALWLHARYAVVLDSSLLQLAILAYLATIALDEIDFRGLLRRVAENRFQRIAMSLSDGLVCTDADGLITLWNPGAAAIFGYQADQIIGQPFRTLCVDPDDAEALFAIRDAAWVAKLAPGGSVIEFDGRRNDGEVFRVEASVSAWQGADGLQYGAILRDVSLRNREAERIRYLAEHDALTGLFNRNTLQARLTVLLSAEDALSRDMALLVIGLDGFQQINDMLGQSYGDLVLRAVADRLTAEFGGQGLVARLSGDEFAVAVSYVTVGDTVAELAEHVARLFDAPLQAGPRQHHVKVSIGVAVHPEGGRTADELLSNGHLAFCRAKAIRRGRHVIFEETIRSELEARLTLEAELALAVERNEFELFYQPQVNLLDGRAIGAEALIRWRHPVRGLVPPAAFIPVVNTSALSETVASWVLQTACRQARTWELAGTPVRIGVNLSPSQLHSGDLAAQVGSLLQDTGLSPALLELEVTEDILLHDEARALDIFKRIEALGVSIVFDDFGTGYASLSYLKKFRLDGLKIDRSFVFDLLTDADDAAIVGSTVSLSRQLGLMVIAEGIENQATADLLLRLGCEHGQGYFFGKPMPAADFERQFLMAKDAGGEGQRGAA
ncbi:Diguanylate cyclase/phosphodiesterase with PAS/PAC and Chase sensor(S) [Bradyrhizobium sp. STM 3843]|uniref:EAL domain-containing protein n=1 Tax=Bradyrhizobium sp. STM 3843 TaxID=551947 RepID=UPI0002404C7A|nr:EAL domain-containing protein [Bradyrhizobium sp. STM 3843]CCE08090.1 Diguanylate cyclase/phosphodiesterase with PAS/PAC and Chase sensor(S) [Bradyrhizobium sp. STM 3843]